MRLVFAGDNAGRVGGTELDKIEIRVEGATDGFDLRKGFDAEVEAAAHPEAIIAEESEEFIEYEG